VSESHQAHYIIATAYSESLKLLMNVQSHPVQANSYLSITDERLVFRKKRDICRRVITISVPEARHINPRIPHTKLATSYIASVPSPDRDVGKRTSGAISVRTLADKV
jgi:hypothetical protein